MGPPELGLPPPADGAERSGADAPRAEGQMLVPPDLGAPAVVVDLDGFLRNVDDMFERCQAAGVALRPHMKTHRCVELGLLQVKRGAAGVSVANVEEAEAFVEAGITDVLVAYPLVGQEAIARIATLSERAAVTVGTDSVVAARAISNFFAARGRSIGLRLIVDSGMHRDGIEPTDAAAVALEISALPGTRLTGIMTHEGQIYRATSPAELEALALAAATTMVRLAADLRSSGIPVHDVSLGASGSAALVIGVDGVSEVRPGIYAFNDVGQLALGTATLATCALRVLATVVSHPTPERACIDAGSKVLSNDRPPGDPTGRYPGYGLLVDLPGWELHRLSEEHGWLRWGGQGEPTPLAVGQRVQIIPNHVCTAIYAMGSCLVLQGGAVVGDYTVIQRRLRRETLHSPTSSR